MGHEPTLYAPKSFSKVSMKFPYKFKILQYLCSVKQNKKCQREKTARRSRIYYSAEEIEGSGERDKIRKLENWKIIGKTLTKDNRQETNDKRQRTTDLRG